MKLAEALNRLEDMVTWTPCGDHKESMQRVRELVIDIMRNINYYNEDDLPFMYNSNRNEYCKKDIENILVDFLEK
jgi:hypothetical protein